MRIVAYSVMLLALAFAQVQVANASTFNLPLNGEVQIIGDLPSPVSVSILVTPNLNGAVGLFFSGELGQAGQPLGPFLPLHVCEGANCFLVAGFFGCGGNIGCAGDPETGYGLPRSNGAQPFEIGTFEISDSSRFLAFSVGVAAGDLVSGLIPITPGTDYLQLTIDLPDGLQAAAFQTDNALVFLAPDATPLPAALPLFATGLGALSLLGWRRKRKQAA